MPDYTECYYDWKFSNGEWTRVDNWLGLDHVKPSKAKWDEASREICDEGVVCSQLFYDYESTPFRVFAEQYMKMIRTSKHNYYDYTHLMNHLTADYL